MNQPLRVALYGNICNNLYQIAKILRTHSDIDAHVYIDETADIQQRPESDDPDLAGRYPPWIHVGNYVTDQYVLFPWISPLVAEFAQYDVLIVSGMGPMYAHFANKPAAFLTSGGDLTVYPFPFRFSYLYKTLRSILWSWTVGFWQRYGIRKIMEVWSQPFSPFTDAVRRLGLTSDQLSPAYFPVIMDCEKLQLQQRQNNAFPEIRKMLEAYDFVLFHPSRLMIKVNDTLRASGQWKQNDLLFRAFARFIQEALAPKAALVMPNRTASPDIDLAKTLIRDLGIEKQVVWLTPPHPFGFTREEMTQLYACANVVSDDFGIGWFGSVVLEACALERPVVSYVDNDAMHKLYPWHPILSGRTEDEVVAHLLRLYRDPAYQRQVGERGRAWIQEFHSGKRVCQVYVDQIRNFVQRQATR